MSRQIHFRTPNFNIFLVLKSSTKIDVSKKIVENESVETILLWNQCESLWWVIPSIDNANINAVSTEQHHYTPH